MFAKNESVVYGTSGVCKIEDIRAERFSKEEPPHPYYILKPISEKSSTLYVPADNDRLAGKMRPLLTKEEIDHLLEQVEDGESIGWIEDDRLRSETFHNILAKGVRTELLKLMKKLYYKKMELQKQGRKFRSVDEKVLLCAEKLVNEEFAYVLGIEEEMVPAYIRQKLDPENGSEQQYGRQLAEQKE